MRRCSQMLSHVVLLLDLGLINPVLASNMDMVAPSKKVVAAALLGLRVAEPKWLSKLVPAGASTKFQALPCQTAKIVYPTKGPTSTYNLPNQSCQLPEPKWKFIEDTKAKVKLERENRDVTTLSSMMAMFIFW